MAFSCCKCFTSKTGKENTKALKIQRLVTPRVLYHKKQILNKKLAQREKVKRDATEYQRLHDLVSYETPLLFPPVWSRVRLYVCVCVTLKTHIWRLEMTLCLLLFRRWHCSA